jgi:hypothetical protein
MVVVRVRIRVVVAAVRLIFGRRLLSWRRVCWSRVVVAVVVFPVWAVRVVA